MKLKTYSMTLASESTTHIATGLTGAGPFTSFTRSGPSDGLAHQLSFTSAADLSAINFTIVGVSQNGTANTETLAGPNATTVETSAYWRSITSITASSTLNANTLDVGIVDEVMLQIVPLDHKSPYAPEYAVEVTGTISYTGMETFNNVLAGVAPVWTNLSALTTKTASVITTGTIQATAFRVQVNSYSAGATLNITVNQPTSPE